MNQKYISSFKNLLIKLINTRKQTFFMAHHGFGLHYLTKKKKREMIDLLVYMVGVLMIILTIPQIITIWIFKEALGVSTITWCAYFVGAIVWVMYGIVHKQKPIIITYSIWMVLDMLIIIGTLIY